MVLTCLILFSIIGVLIVLTVIGLLCNEPPAKSFKYMFLNKDKDYVMFNCLLSLVLFMVMFLTSAATYNTYIDKDNPHYFKKDKNYISKQIKNK